MNHKVLIVGGGFAGIQTARSLGFFYFKNKDITLISNKTYFEYYPALYRIVTGASPIEIAVPLHDLLPKSIDIVHDTVHIIDPLKKEVTTSEGVYNYDTLILALGAEVNDFGIKGVKEYTYKFRSVGDALKIKHDISKLIYTCPRNGLPENCYKISIVGGGPTGVELAGDIISHLEDLVVKTGVSKNVVEVNLIEAGDRILGNLSEEVSNIAKKKLENLGVIVRTGIKITEVKSDAVVYGDISIPSRMIIWSGGIKPNRVYNTIPGVDFAKNGKIIIDEYLRPIPYEDIFIIGDGANTRKSGLAQTAVIDAKYVASIINRTLIGLKPKKYKEKFTGHAIPIGHKDAVVSMGPLAFSGRLAYFLRHFIDFDFFAGWLSLPKMLDLFWEGYKYRKLHHEDENIEP